ncbi:MAG: hypothetical protein JSS23_01085 [Proteobacteria bacterium]|nr:hypothetical protein [Pseudomonadota bacterium]
MRFPKTLLLSRTLPGTGHVGEIILADVVRHVGIDRFHCVAPVASNYVNQPDPELVGLSVRTLMTDQLEAKRWGRGKLGAAGSLINGYTGFRSEVARCTREIVDEGRKVGAGQVFAVLENPLTFALAHRVSARLQVPMRILVWDPPEYLLRNHRYDRWSCNTLLREFRHSLAASERVAVVSETMQRDYAAFTKAPIQILRHGLPVPESTGSKSDSGLPKEEWLIGFAGSMYANDAWNALLNALDQVEWKVAGRPVRIRLLTGKITMQGRHGACIDYLGFRPPEQVQEILAGCHLTYLPQPFSANLRDLRRYAFPTKLANYLVLGRPVFVHAPEDGALSKFVENNPIGVQANSLESERILSALERIFLEPSLYESASTDALKVASLHFSRSVFNSSVDAFLGIQSRNPVNIPKSCVASPAF